MLIACSAERLGVEIPAGGADTISAEDLQRDAYALTQAAADPGPVFARRLEQMHLAPEKGDGWVCGRRGGAAAPRVVVAPWPTTPAEAAEAGVLISVAKGWDGQPPPTHTIWLCIARADAAQLPAGDRVELGVRIDADRLEAIDYRRLRGEVQTWFHTLDQ